MRVFIGEVSNVDGVRVFKALPIFVQDPEVADALVVKITNGGPEATRGVIRKMLQQLKATNCAMCGVVPDVQDRGVWLYTETTERGVSTLQNDNPECWGTFYLEDPASPFNIDPITEVMGG
jgi:hypothetical protein